MALDTRIRKLEGGTGKRRRILVVAFGDEDIYEATQKKLTEESLIADECDIKTMVVQFIEPGGVLNEHGNKITAA